MSERLRRGVARGNALWNRLGVLRIAVSLILIAILFWKLDAGALVARWREIRPVHFGMAILYLAASNLLGCVQWMTLLRAQGLRPSIGTVIGSYHVGLFMSNFLPGYYGGDAVRVLDIYRETGEGTRALAATFLDRVLGLVTLCLLALLVSPSFVGRGERTALLALLAVSAALGAVFLFFLSRRLARPFRFLLRPFDTLGLGARLRAGYDAVHLYRHRLRALALAMLLSLGVQALRVLVHYETARALGVAASMATFFLLVPIVAIVIALPISVNGIGLREGTGILLFGQAGIGKEDAFGLLFLAYLAGVVVSLSGGVVFALRGRRAAGSPVAFDPPSTP